MTDAIFEHLIDEGAQAAATSDGATEHRLALSGVTTSMSAAIRGYSAARRSNTLLLIPFDSVIDYLFLLRAAAVDTGKCCYCRDQAHHSVIR